jgi:hypothetical protein
MGLRSCTNSPLETKGYRRGQTLQSMSRCDALREKRVSPTSGWAIGPCIVIRFGLRDQTVSVGGNDVQHDDRGCESQEESTEEEQELSVEPEGIPSGLRASTVAIDLLAHLPEKKGLAVVKS